MRDIGTEYLFKCRENYFKDIRPSCKEVYDSEDYKFLSQLAQFYILERGAEEFSGFFQEAQYLVNLWTAHFLISVEDIVSKTRAESLDIIVRYSQTEMNSVLAFEEKQWLVENSLYTNNGL